MRIPGKRSGLDGAMKRVRQEASKAEGLGGKECLAILLTEFNNVCKRSAKEEEVRVRDFLSVTGLCWKLQMKFKSWHAVEEIGSLVMRWNVSWRKVISRIWEQFIGRIATEAEQHRLEKGQGSHQVFWKVFFQC